MTVIEATNKIWDYFSKNDVIVQTSYGQDDISKALLIVSDDISKERAAALCALNDLEKAEVVSRFHIEEENKTLWILKRPFASFNQTVEVEPNLAIAISQIINQFCESIEDKTDTCDSTHLTGKDIKNLYLISIHLASKLEDKIK